jgi:chromosome segregation ATPase
VKDLETRIQDLTKTIQNVQPKYRQAIADKGRAEAERDAAQSQAIKLNEVNNTRVEEIAKLKAEKTNLEAELTVARAALSTSSVPEAAKLAQAQDQIRELLAEKERLEKRVASVQGNFDFTRDAYQKASSHVTELNNEINQLKEENMILNRQASDNRVRIAEIQRASEAKQREERIEELEALLKDRERELAKKSEELKIKTNGRRETRGTSVPRSPRLGSGAMSPRPQFARTAGGSRGASPAPGEAREGFRDPPLFPPSGLGSARYSHLA